MTQARFYRFGHEWPKTSISAVDAEMEAGVHCPEIFRLRENAEAVWAVGERRVRTLADALPSDTIVSDVRVGGRIMRRISNVSQLREALENPAAAAAKEAAALVASLRKRPPAVRPMPHGGVTADKSAKPSGSPLTEGRVETRLIGPCVKHHSWRAEKTTHAGGWCDAVVETAYCPPCAPWCAEIWRKGTPNGMPRAWSWILYVSDDVDWRLALYELAAKVELAELQLED